MTMSKRMRLSVGWVPGQVAELCRVAPLKTHSRWMKVQRMFAPWYRPPPFPPENPSVSDETPGSGGRRTSHPSK